jgi:hypothetical protein
MREELVPFGGGEIAVFFAGPLGPAAGDERPVAVDGLLGIDGLWCSQIFPTV